VNDRLRDKVSYLPRSAPGAILRQTGLQTVSNTEIIKANREIGLVMISWWLKNPYHWRYFLSQVVHAK